MFISIHHSFKIELNVFIGFQVFKSTVSRERRKEREGKFPVFIGIKHFTGFNFLYQIRL